MNRMSWVLGLVLVALFLALAGIPQSLACAADTTPPTGTIVINNNRSATNSPNVTLALNWNDGVGGSGVSQMRFSDDGAHWTAWGALAATRAYALPAGADGHRTVRVQYIDKANNRSAVYSDYIRLDTTLPTGSIIINNGAATTATRSVTLGLTWSDAGAGVSRMRFSDNGSTWTAWMLPAATRAHTLPSGNGNHTVRVQYLDGANNYSAVYSDYIRLEDPGEQTVMLPGDVPLVMRWVPGGTFSMGRYSGEQDSYSNESPQHTVTLGGYWMAKYELTKRQWTAVMGTTPWAGQPNIFADLDSPAVYVSWNNAQAFLTAVNSYTGKTFRVPSEAQWEYACRAGTTTRFYWGDDLDDAVISGYAWWDGNAGSAGQQYAHVAGQKLPNALGLCDMSGNVWEWCQDGWHANYSGAPTDGSAWESPDDLYRVIRGGGYDSFGSFCRSAYRYYLDPDFVDNFMGFRVVWIP